MISQESQIRSFVAPFYLAATGRPPPQLPVWSFANELLSPFCTPEEQRSTLLETGIDFGNATGFDDIPGTCDVQVASENGKINVNRPLSLAGDEAKSSVAMQLFSLIGGYQPGNPYDVLFNKPDSDGNITTRLDLVSAMLDWWDPNLQQSNLDPGAGEVRSSSSSSSSDSIYQRYDDPYRNKNAPFDSIQELRLIRGVSDDFWATFVEPVPNDPVSRILTVYSPGQLDVNQATPQALLALVCSIANQVTLCTDPLEGARFIEVLRTIKVLIPIPLFSRSTDFTDFLEGKGNQQQPYPHA